MKSKIRITCLAAIFVAPAWGAEKAQEPALKRALIITGRDVAAHNWRETTPVLREFLEQTRQFDVVVSEEPLVLESSALANYDVVILNYYNWQRPGLSEKARQNLVDFVKQGKGLVSFHFSVRAFEDWPEYRNLVGRIWTKGSGHGPRGAFSVKVADPDHAITRGLSAFEADDELYARLVGDAPIHVLLEADSTWSKRTEPLVWTLDYGKGRVFAIALGHDVKACRNPNFVSLFQRGTQWAAGAEVK
jgi:uncharacterized protein